jgi:hypothetical protein
MKRDVMPVGSVLDDVLPEGLTRGSLVTVSSAAITLLLLAAATQSGSWAATVGYPELGWLAAAEAGVVLHRCATVPAAGRNSAKVIASLLDAVDVVVVHQVGAMSTGDARRLVARARERRAILLLDHANLPVSTSTTISVGASRWEGLRNGNGHIQGRWADVQVTGRGAFSQGRDAWVWFGGETSRTPRPDKTAPIVEFPGKLMRHERHVS